MKRGTWILVFLMAVSLVGIASAETPAAPPAAQAAVSPETVVTSPAAVAEEAPTVDLAQIFGLPNSGVSSMPAPTPRSCTLFQCKQPCRVPGCFASCIDLETCECETICQ